VRDWSAMVSEKLTKLGLPPAQHQETVRELAAHLEDQYEEGRAQGLTESAACELALKEVADWRRLSREIHRARRQEESMKNRTMKLWLPGLATGFAAMSTLSILSYAGLEPRIILLGAGESLQLPIPWLLMLPVFGALGAYLSRRADGKRMTRIAAALFPAIVLLAMLFFGAFVSVFVDHRLREHPLPFLFGLVTFNWVFLPSAALLLGALPFLQNSQRIGAGQTT
jgi:hypothetical protein